MVITIGVNSNGILVTPLCTDPPFLEHLGVISLLAGTYLGLPFTRLVVQILLDVAHTAHVG